MKETIGIGGMCAVLFLAYWFGMRYPVGKYSRDWEQRKYTVEHFTTDLTIRIQCAGDCDLAAMIAEAREATNGEK